MEKDDIVCYFREHPEATRKVGIVRKTGMKIFNKTADKRKEPMRGRAIIQIASMFLQISF